MAFPDFPPSIPVFLKQAVGRFGERPLILLNEERSTYAEANCRSRRLARGLLASGVAKGTRIGLLMPNGPDWVVAWQAATRIGAVLVPINTFYKSRELGWILHHADVHTLLTVPRFLGNDYLERLESCAPGLDTQKAGAIALPSLPQLRNVCVWGGCDRSWATSDRDLEAAADAAPAFDETFLDAVEDCVVPADPMVIIYSSGSTADPKGAVHTHGSVIRHSFNLNGFRDLTEEDRIFSPMPFFWVGGFVFTLLAAMHRGAFMICEELFEPGETLALLERERATIVAGWPHYSRAMADHPTFAERDLSSIRAGNLYEILPEALRPRDPELRSNALGMTETCGPHTIEWMNRDLPEELRGAFGRSAPDVEHKIVDPETGATLDTGTEGEICVRGYNVMQGLYKVEREATFDADGFYHTGDVGHFDAEGWLFFTGRKGDLIKTAGANVTPREVEVVMDAYPEVKASYVVGVPDPDRGQNVAAAVVLKKDTALAFKDLRERLRGELSAYKIPRHIFFYEDGELPFTDSGKIDKRRLTETLSRRVAEESQ
jgi:acyl-CoA synthetase (AMP-forming)/AMP-acid ligase II